MLSHLRLPRPAVVYSGSLLVQSHILSRSLSGLNGRGASRVLSTTLEARCYANSLAVRCSRQEHIFLRGMALTVTELLSGLESTNGDSSVRPALDESSS